MQGARLGPTHHVGRHCRKNDLAWTGPAATAVLEGAFEPDTDGVSVTWLEHFPGDQRQRLVEVRKTICDFLTPKRQNRLAVLNVGKAAAAAANVHVVEDPFTLPAPGNPAHALMKEPADLRDIKTREALAATIDPGDIHSY